MKISIRFLFLYFVIFSQLAIASQVCGVVGEIHIPDEGIQQPARTYDELKTLLASNEKNICIPSGVTINLINMDRSLIIKDHVKLSTCNYKEGVERAIITTNAINNGEAHYYPLIQIGDSSTIANLQIIGPWLGTTTETENRTIAMQTQARTNNQVFYNNKIAGWSSIGLALTRTRNVKIHHNNIHDNYWQEGYGVSIHTNSEAEVYCNTFDNNRHSMAGSGQIGDAYIFRNNIQMTKSRRHVVDMHRSQYPETEGNISGAHITIIDNYFVYGGERWGKEPSIKLISAPTEGPAEITGNIFRHPFYFESGASRAIIQNLSQMENNPEPSDEELQATNTFAAKTRFRKFSNNNCQLLMNDKKEQFTCDAFYGLLKDGHIDKGQPDVWQIDLNHQFNLMPRLKSQTITTQSPVQFNLQVTQHVDLNVLNNVKLSVVIKDANQRIIDQQNTIVTLKPGVLVEYKPEFLIKGYDNQLLTAESNIIMDNNLNTGEDMNKLSSVEFKISSAVTEIPLIKEVPFLSDLMSIFMGFFIVISVFLKRKFKFSN